MSVCGLKLWNSLGLEHKHCQSIHQFKALYKHKVLYPGGRGLIADDVFIGCVILLDSVAPHINTVFVTSF